MTTGGAAPGRAGPWRRAGRWAVGAARHAAVALALAPALACVPAPGEAAPAARPEPESVALHFPRGTGAALLRRGGAVLAVFDSPDLRNPEALRGATVAGLVEAKALPHGLVLAIPAASVPWGVGLSRGPSGWVLDFAQRAGAGAGRRVGGSLADGAAGAPATAAAVALLGVPPGKVVAVRDPESGLPLLVGTTPEAGRGFTGGRRAPEYDVLGTELGVAVLARSENLQLRAAPGRFLLSGGVSAPLAFDAAALGPAAGAAMTRCLGLPDLPPERLLARARAQTALLAETAPLARGARRRELAATLLALGMAHEAQAEMNRASAEDAGPASGAREARALAAAAALLAGRAAEAAFLGADAPADAAAGCDELVLWRSLFAAPAAAALPGLEATLPLLRSYPPGLRNRLLPIAAEAFAEAGAWGALRALLADPSDRARLPLASAMLAEADGEDEAALAAYDALGRGRDRRARAAALRRAVELRLRTGRMDAAAAARAYGASLAAWRGDAAEREARERLARLLALSGDPGGALASLRQTAALFPDRAPDLRKDAAGILLDAFDGGSPLAAASAFEAGADLVPPAEREALEARLADALVALDLPARASALLAEAARRASAGEARAEIGARLAELRLGEGDPEGARSALGETDAPGVPEALRARRAALAAAAEERRGGGPARPGLEVPAAGAADAVLGRRDWAAAARALQGHLDARLPPAPAPMGAEHREAALRLAAALVLAGDDAALAALGERVAGRMGEGPHAERFTHLVAGAAPLRLGPLSRATTPPSAAGP